MARIREAEFSQAMETLGVSWLGLGFSDLNLEKERKELEREVIQLVRNLNPGLLVSFHPQTHVMEHGDHRIAGEVSLRAREVSDVRFFEPDLGVPTKSRPDLLLSLNDSPPTVFPSHWIGYSEATSTNKSGHLLHYPSQFGRNPEQAKQWQEAIRNVHVNVTRQYQLPTREGEVYRLIR